MFYKHLLLNLIWRASLTMISKSFLPESIIEKLLHEKFDLHVALATRAINLQ